MKRYVWMGLACMSLMAALAPAAQSQEKLAAFPGAEGFGKYAEGGRGGDVYHVTKLTDDRSEGTLRHAIESADGPRTVVFDVAGYIDLNGPLGLTKSHMTLAGQTAPGGGIGVRGYKVSLGAPHLIVRHMRFRIGVYNDNKKDDALNINRNVDNAIVDHCSIQFSRDENNSMDRPHNVTVQWTINAWGLQTHSCGSLLYANNTTVHHNLWAHNHTRNPKSRYGLLDWVNNVTFDWNIPFILADTRSEEVLSFSNVVGNYFIAGRPTDEAFVKGHLSTAGKPTYAIYLDDTWLDGNADGKLDVTHKGYDMLSGDVDRRAEPYPTDWAALRATDPLTAYREVVSHVGAWPRDAVDEILVNDLVTQNRRIIADQRELGLDNEGFGTLAAGEAPQDTDRDGIPDYFEKANHWDIHTPNNNTVMTDGYTQLELYLNWLAGPHVRVKSGESVDVDLKQFASGFPNGEFKVRGFLSGKVEMLEDGTTARYNWEAKGGGALGFYFTVTEGDSTMKRYVGVLVEQD